MIHARCEVTLEDYLEFNRMWRMRSWKKIAAIYFGLLVFHASAAIATGQYVFFLAHLGMWVLLFVALALLARRQFVNLVRANSAMTGHSEWEIGESGIRVRNSSADTTLAWSSFAGFDAGPRLFVLVCSPHLARFVPRRAFPDEASQARFVELARARIPSP